jgi:hypothetical protein
MSSSSVIKAIPETRRGTLQSRNTSRLSYFLDDHLAEDG